MAGRRASLSDHLVSSLGALTSCRPGARRGGDTRGSLTFTPSGTRISTLKRHSLASVELATWAVRTANNRRASTFTLPFLPSFSPVEATTRADSLESVQAAIIKLFQRKNLKEHELSTLQDTIRALCDAEAGSLIYEYYKDQLLKKGMVILREKIKNEQGPELLTMLGETWDYFFREILPTLQALMVPLAAAMKTVDVRNTTLLEFRNIVVLKVGLKDAVEGKRYQVPANIRQMLLVLQGVQDPTFLSKEQLDLERMAAWVIVPFLGTRGLYQGSPDPVTKAAYRPAMPHVSSLLQAKPSITVTVFEDSPRCLPSATLTLTSPGLHRLEQQHPIASPNAMRRRPPPSATGPSSPSSPTPSSPTSSSSSSSFSPAREGYSSGGVMMMAPTKLKPVIEDVVIVGRRHSVVGT
ncbi:uncharacterized protein LOC143298055 isoform X2 [Babylonia areolata]|uniref:uncharacterized protein LOC143298055 isoform X2 n=1 Tax=Babylonia areolata TaxID=304850 RepID=UPI003FD57AAC